MFLTSAQLLELTGYRLAAHQKRWLERNGVAYLVDVAGRPRVLVSVLEARMGLRPAAANDKATVPRLAEPNLAAVR